VNFSRSGFRINPSGGKRLLLNQIDQEVFALKRFSVNRIAALTLAAVLALGGSASALFGKKSETLPQEGGPEARDVELQTYRGIPVQGQFLASDQEGADLTFAVAEEPKKGSVEVEGALFTYTPKEGASGADRFTYTATDSQGRVSDPATVTVTIEKTKSGVAYSDTQDSKAAAAAQRLAEEGIFTGSKIGGQYYFQPDKNVSRSEFLAMVLETAGREAPAVTVTGFCDDEAIPTWAKAYVSAGVSDGIVQGRPTAEGLAFRGDDAITFNEAAALLDRTLDTGDVDLDVWYADREAAPSWAAQAVGNLEAVSVLSAGSFGSPTMEAYVTRADAAQMLSAAKTLLDGEEQEGLFGWFQ